jgi:hypothetical protein
MSLLDTMPQPPTDVVKAASAAEMTPQKIESVKTWLAGATNVHHLSDVLRCLSCTISTAKVDLARLAIARGADPNARCDNGEPILYYAVTCNTIATPAFVALLLGSGADVNQRNGEGTLPLGSAITRLMWSVDDERRRAALQVVTMLLRAGSGVDVQCAASWAGKTAESAEEHISYWERQSEHPFQGCSIRDEPFRVLKALIRGVSAAGSWRAYERRFHRWTLPRFRSLVVRGRATSADALLVALAHLPHRPFRAVLAFGP